MSAASPAPRPGAHAPSALRRCAALLALALPAAAGVASAANDFSSAEQALFMGTPLASLRPPLTLAYAFHKSGSLEAPFDDTVGLDLTPQADGRCCAVKARFFSGPRELKQPEVDSAQGNPAVLYFLERDIREMQRLTGGQPNYFRKRIRMAIYQGATQRDLTLPYRGSPVAVKEFTIAPYQDDPNRVRFEKLTGKRYAFYVSDAVPGGLYAIRARIDGDGPAAPPVLQEDLVLDGAEAPPAPAPRRP